MRQIEAKLLIGLTGHTAKTVTDEEAIGEVNDMLDQAIDGRGELEITVVARLKLRDPMKAILTTTNVDEVSGTTILSDGTKAFWAEGRSSDVIVIDPQGKIHAISADHGTKPTLYLREVFDVLSDGDMGAMRPATMTEEIEHRKMRRQA